MDNIKTYNHGLPWEDEHGISQGYSVNGTIYISGQFSHDAEGRFIGAGDIEAQTRQTLMNIDKVLGNFGASKSNIAEIEIFLTDPQRDFEKCIKIFKEYVGNHKPAGTLVGVTGMAFPGQLIEIRAVAHIN